MGWDGLLLLNILHNNQLKELGIQVPIQWLLCQKDYREDLSTIFVCQYMYSWGKTNGQAIDSIGQPICYQIIPQILKIPKMPVRVSNYTADNEDMYPLVK